MSMAEAKNARARATEEVADDPELWFPVPTPELSSPMSVKVNMELESSETPRAATPQEPKYISETGNFAFVKTGLEK